MRNCLGTHNSISSLRRLILPLQVGLSPIVIHGAGPQLNKRLEDAGVEPNFVEGIRVTDSKTLEVAREIFYNENIRLVEALEKAGTRARPIIGTTAGRYQDNTATAY